jgi:serine/threonine protein kinase
MSNIKITDNMIPPEDTISKYEPLWGIWTIESLIGEGSFGKVYKVCRRDVADNEVSESGKTYCSALKIITIPQNQSEVKRMEMEGLDETSIRSFFQALVTDITNEIGLISELRGHSHIVSYEDHMIIDKAVPGSQLGWDILIRMDWEVYIWSGNGRNPVMNVARITITEKDVWFYADITLETQDVAWIFVKGPSIRSRWYLEVETSKIIYSGYAH